MGKITIIKALKLRFRFRILTVLACLVLVVALGGILISNNPRLTRANGIYLISEICTVEGAWELVWNDPYCDGYNVSVPAGATLTIRGGRTFKDVTVDGGTLITYGGPHNFTNLTVKNSGTVTHDALAQNETIIADNSSTKMVNLNVSGRLLLESGGKINVDGKGYAGGVRDDVNGDGPGGGGGHFAGEFTLEYDTFGAGGSNAGWGGNGAYDTSDSGGATGITGPSPYPSFLLPQYQYGSGGGYAFAHRTGGSAESFGGSGGGRIKINADTIELSGSSFISANGTSSVAQQDRNQNNKKVAGGGAGGGGYISITVSKYLASTQSGVDPSGNVKAGQLTSGSKGTVGQITAGLSNYAYLYAVHAYGGDALDGTEATNSGGTGGGGYVSITTSSFASTCLLQSGVNKPIPADCENRDVVVDGLNQDLPTDYLTNTTTAKVYADLSDTSLASSKRHFSSLTIKNKGVLTHLGSSDYSDQAVFKKLAAVDIETSGDITLESGGVIDVTGKGYAGGAAGTADVLYVYSHPTNGMGPGGGKAAAYGEWTLPAGYTNNLVNNDLVGGGGSYAGAGGGVTGTNSYSDGSTSWSASLYSTGTFGLGSGGGGVSNMTVTSSVFAGEPNFRFASGGAGGGRVRLVSTAGKIIFHGTAQVLAKGLKGSNHCTLSCDASAIGGSGSGGSIILNATEFDFDTSPNINADNGANGSAIAPNGLVQSAPTLVLAPSITGNINILAGGGNLNDSNTTNLGGYGGGGAIVFELVTRNGVTIKKTLTAIERPGASPINNFNPYALRKNDKILVTLDLTNLPTGQSVTVTDDLLTTPGGSTSYAICGGDIIDGPTDQGYTSKTASLITWTFTPASQSKRLSYQCKVQ
ncbi:MAG: hypothetical protein WC227_02455 [Patescibacteria group bacterium]